MNNSFPPHATEDVVVIGNQPSSLPVLTSARVNYNTSGDHAIVAAVAAQTTRVHRLKISVAGAVIVTIKDGSTVLDVYNFSGAGGAIILDFSVEPWYVTSANSALNINLSANVQTDGRIEYLTS